MGDKTIPDSAEPRLESFYPPFVAGIDLPHQGAVDSYSLIHPGVRDKRRGSEIDLSQPMHETPFLWRHNGPVTSQLIDPIKWPNYPLESIVINVHINTHNKESLTHRCRRSTNLQLCLIFCMYLYGLSLNGWHTSFSIINNHHGVTITTHVIKRDFPIWMTTARQPRKRRCPSALIIKHTFICIYCWTRQIIHHTLIVVDRNLRLMGDKTIPDSRVPRLASLYSSQVSIYHIKVWWIFIINTWVELY